MTRLPSKRTFGGVLLQLIWKGKIVDAIFRRGKRNQGRRTQRIQDSLRSGVVPNAGHANRPESEDRHASQGKNTIGPAVGLHLEDGEPETIH